MNDTRRKALLIVYMNASGKSYFERLNWLNEVTSRLFKETGILFAKMAYGSVTEASKDSLFMWDEVNHDFQSLFSILMTKYYYKDVYEKRPCFDFAWLIRLSDDADTVFHWGLENGYSGRVILRAAFLLTRGNVLFGSWGLRTAGRYEVEQELHKTLTVHPYVSGGVLKRRYPGKTLGAAFNLFIDHYIPPISNFSLPSEEVIDKVRAGMVGTLFTPKQLRTAYYNANYHLFFDSDYVVLYYYRWHSFRDLQKDVVDNYVRLRGWTVDSTWLELVIDILWFGVFWSTFVAVSIHVQPSVARTNNLAFLDPFWTASRFIGWIIIWELFVYRRLTGRIPLDRFSLWRLATVFGWYLFEFSILDVLATGIMQVYWPLASHEHGQIFGIWLGIAFVDAVSCAFSQDLPLHRFTRDVITVSICGIGLGILSFYWDATRLFATTGAFVAAYTLGMVGFTLVVQETKTKLLVDRQLFHRFVTLPLATAVILQGCTWIVAHLKKTLYF